jgi:[ribosomal protein S5]-alanine N-acetyltransferase
LTIGNVTHGALRSAWIDYWVCNSMTGRGVATGALALGLDHCFGPVRLHRIEIDIRPENEASLRVVEKLGLRREGYYERYLDIDNGWRDHIAFGITVEELRGSSMISRLGRLAVPPGTSA